MWQWREVILQAVLVIVAQRTLAGTAPHSVDGPGDEHTPGPGAGSAKHARAKAPDYVGIAHTNEGRNSLSALTIGRDFSWSQEKVCDFPNATMFMVGTHQSSYARQRGVLYKALQYGSDQRIVKVLVDRTTWTFDCRTLPVNLPIQAGEFRVDIFPDQEVHDPKPTIVGALNGSPSKEYELYELLEEDSSHPTFRSLMTVTLKHNVRQVFGSYYDDEAMIEYIGFNEGASFFSVNPCWLVVVDVKNRKVLSATYYEHLSGYDIWWDAALKSFFIPTNDDCAEPNKTMCIQGVRVWEPSQTSLSDAQTNMCDGSVCFTFEVAYGYAYDPNNHTAVLYGGVSGWWWYNTVTKAMDQYEYSTVFVNSPVYTGEPEP